MNQQILDYIARYQGQYDNAELKALLLNTGYSSKEIEEAFTSLNIQTTGYVNQELLSQGAREDSQRTLKKILISIIIFSLLGAGSLLGYQYGYTPLKELKIAATQTTKTETTASTKKSQPTTTTTTTVAPSGDTYKNNEIEVKIPKEWTKYNNPGVQLTLIRPDSTGMAVAEVDVIKILGVSMSLEELIAQSDGYSQVLQGVKISSGEYTTFDGVKAYREITQGARRDLQMKFYTFIFKKFDRFYAVSYNGIASKYDLYFEEGKKIMDSVHISY